MKKKLFIIIITVVILVISESLILWWLAPKYFLKNADNIHSIEVFDGSTGKHFEITDTQSIERIVNGIQGKKFKKSGISANIDGFRFSMSFKDENGDLIDSFIINSNNKIRKEPFFYDTDGNMDIFDFLEQLENNI